MGALAMVGSVGARRRGVGLAKGWVLCNASAGACHASGVTDAAAWMLVPTAAVLVPVGTTATLAGVLSGSGALTVVGGGQLTLSGANTYAGGTTIPAGATLIGHTGGVGSSFGAGPIRNDGLIQCNSPNLVLTAPVSGSGTLYALANLTLAGPLAGPFEQHVLQSSAPSGGGAGPTLTLTGNHAVVDTVNLGQGGGYAATAALVLTHASLAITGKLQTNNGGAGSYMRVTATDATIDCDGIAFPGANYASTGYVSVTGGSLTVGSSGVTAGQGTSYLSLSDATYAASATHTLHTSAATQISGSVTVGVVPGATLTMQQGLSGSGALVVSGPGTCAINAGSTYTGGTTVNGGTLKAGNVTAFGAGPITVNAGGTLAKNGFNLANPIINNGGTVTP